MKESFGGYIRNLRKEKQLTLTQLAAKLDLDSANLSKIENGKREFDSKRLKKLADIFELDLKKLTNEFLSDQFAKMLYESNCDIEVFKLAEEKVKYIAEKDTKQTILNI